MTGESTDKVPACASGTPGACARAGSQVRRHARRQCYAALQAESTWTAGGTGLSKQREGLGPC